MKFVTSENTDFKIKNIDLLLAIKIEYQYSSGFKNVVLKETHNPYREGVFIILIKL